MYIASYHVMNFLRRLTFNFWYYRNPPWDTGISPPELLQFIASHPPGQALDLGCGSGTNVITLAKHGWKATGADFAGRAIRLAREKARRAGVDVCFYVDDVTKLEHISGQFDLILDIGCFHSLPEDGRQAYLRTVEQLLSPGGTYLHYVFFKNIQNDGGPGITEADLEAVAAALDLVSRVDGSERGLRPSAWLTYCKR